MTLKPGQTAGPSACTRRTHGFTILELMIAMSIGLVLMIGLMTVFIGNSAAERFSDQLSDVQTKGRIAVTWLKHDLLMAGSKAMIHNPSTLRLTSVTGMQPTLSGNCFTRATRPSDWALGILPQELGDPTPAVYGVESSESAYSSFGSCLSAADGHAGSDILSLHYAHPQAVQPSALVNNGVYLHSGLGGGVVFQCKVSGADCLDALTDKRTDPTGSWIHRVVSHLYYVRQWYSTSDDNIPTLVRVELQPDGLIRHQALVPGMRSFQVLYGFDTDENNEVDQYRRADQLVSAATTAGMSGDWQRVKSVRLGMLVESTQPVGGDAGASQSLSVEGQSVEVGAGHLGRVFSTTVAIRNPGRSDGM